MGKIKAVYFPRNGFISFDIQIDLNKLITIITHCDVDTYELMLHEAYEEKKRTYKKYVT